MPRYFRASDEVYASLCEQFDAAYGYPRQETLTERALPAIDTLPTDEQGRVYLAVSAAMCDYYLPSQLLPGLIYGGQIEEITAEQYATVLPEDTDA